jgi:hypothetical protein
VLAGAQAEASFGWARARATSAAGSRDRDADPHGDSGRNRRSQRRHNGSMPGLPDAPWWTVRPSANRKPSTYRCPLCGHHLAALSEHMLIAPEGDTRRRRHAHTDCVLAARRRGQLTFKDEWQARLPRSPSLWGRLIAARSRRRESKN